MHRWPQPNLVGPLSTLLSPLVLCPCDFYAVTATMAPSCLQAGWGRANPAMGFLAEQLGPI